MNELVLSFSSSLIMPPPVCCSPHSLDLDSLLRMLSNLVLSLSPYKITEMSKLN
jgi:hypothetical protein